MKRLSIILLVAIGLLVSSCSSAKSPVSVSAPITESSVISIVFSSNMNGLYNIYAVKPDGSELTQLTDNAAQYYSQTWCATRQQFAVSANGKTINPDRIYLMGYDCTHGTLLVDGTLLSPPLTTITNLAWSPDGSYLAFCGATLDTKTPALLYNIYIVTAPPIINQGVKELTSFTTPTPPNIFKWSPDGSKIVFMTANNITHYYSLTVMNADGRGQRVLTQGTGGISPYFSWSPDGRQITFAAGKDYADPRADWEVYTINTDSSGLRPLTTSNAMEMAPAWSPDGTRIAFFSDRDGYNAIYVMNADGSNQTRITDSHFSCMYPQWSPDSKQITYIVNDGTMVIPHWLGLYIMNADGSGQRKLADGALGGGVAWVALPSYPLPPTPRTSQ